MMAPARSPKGAPVKVGLPNCKPYRETLPLVDARPPNFDKILSAMPEARKAGVIFAYDGKVYAPGCRKITRELDAHERVHVERQGADPAGWWDRYIAEPEFRFEEELVAHQAEYAMFCRRFLDPMKRYVQLGVIAKKLASPLYGSLITPGQAAIQIELGVPHVKRWVAV
jgi:hypothetical protein